MFHHPTLRSTTTMPCFQIHIMKFHFITYLDGAWYHRGNFRVGPKEKIFDFTHRSSGNNQIDHALSGQYNIRLEHIRQIICRHRRNRYDYSIWSHWRGKLHHFLKSLFDTTVLFTVGDFLYFVHILSSPNLQRNTSHTIHDTWYFNHLIAIKTKLFTILWEQWDFTSIMISTTREFLGISLM